jgi:hypothetical protein
MGKEVTVACVYWKGKFRGREKCYDLSWVEKMRNMVARNMSVPYRFVCLTNVENNVPCDRVPLKQGWPGWWAKLELFDPDNFTGRVLYLDLDLVIRKDLKPLIQYPSPFVLMKQPVQLGRMHTKDGLEVVIYNSSVMSFDAGAGAAIFQQFNGNVMDKYRGDQDWIGEVEPHLDTFPPDWVLKLRYCKGGTPPNKSIVVLCMPGKNIIASRKHEWIRKLWV